MNSSLIPITDIQRARTRLHSVVVKTPLQHNETLSLKYGANVYLKREDMQIVRSFKIRGAYNKIASLNPEEMAFGVVCASAGNHAQGVAYACSALNVEGTIFMPATTPRQKVSKVKHFGTEAIKVVLIGDTFDDAQREAVKYQQETGAVFVHPFDDREVMAGQGTVATEILEEAGGHIDYLIVAVGGGGLISGVGSYVKQVSPGTKVIGVEAAGSAAMTASIEKGEIVRLSKIDSFADGIAVKEVGKETFNIARIVMDRLLTIPEGHICATILELYNEQAIVAEPAGAISVSALDYIREEISGKNVVVLLCGGNNDISRTTEIRERALLWEGRKHYFIIRFPQRAGALREFLDVLGPDDDIAHFEYTKKRNRETGPALVGIELKNANDYNLLIDRMEKAKIHYLPLNDDPMLFEMLI